LTRGAQERYFHATDPAGSREEKIPLAHFSPMDLLFCGIAVYEGYKFSFRRLTPQEIERAMAV